jgi:hypothetical protein
MRIVYIVYTIPHFTEESSAMQRAAHSRFFPERYRVRNSRACTHHASACAHQSHPTASVGYSLSGGHEPAQQRLHSSLIGLHSSV